jgi:hypothetical protein
MNKLSAGFLSKPEKDSPFDEILAMVIVGFSLVGMAVAIYLPVAWYFADEKPVAVLEEQKPADEGAIFREWRIVPEPPVIKPYEDEENSDGDKTWKFDPANKPKEWSI